MVIDSFEEHRQKTRSKIDGLQLWSNGPGRHAIAYQTPYNDGQRRWLVDVLEKTSDGGFDLYTYGHNMPLTCKMAEEIVFRFVGGKQIPKRLEWR
jgi:hypothetical protein